MDVLFPESLHVTRPVPTGQSIVAPVLAQRTYDAYQQRIMQTPTLSVVSTSATINIPTQAIQFVIFAVLVILVSFGLSYFISSQQVLHCKRMYGGPFATPVSNDIFLNEIKSYIDA